MKTGVIIQARMGSTRLPGKVMRKIKGKTILAHVIDRVKKSKLIEQIIVATSSNDIDNLIERESKLNNVTVFRGSEDDVLSRYFYAAKMFNLDTVVRITSDCPLIDYQILDKIIKELNGSNYDIATNAGIDNSLRTFPRGLDVEVFTFKVLEEAYFKAKEPYQREHVTPYIYENSEKVHYITNEVDYSTYRLTLDTLEDYELITTIYDELYKGEHDFLMAEIINLLKRKPQLTRLNQSVKQKEL